MHQKTERTREDPRRDFWMLWDQNWLMIKSVMNVNEGKMWFIKWKEWWLKTEVRIVAAGTESFCRKLRLVNFNLVRNFLEFEKFDFRD